MLSAIASIQAIHTNINNHHDTNDNDNHDSTTTVIQQNDTSTAFVTQTAVPENDENAIDTVHNSTEPITIPVDQSLTSSAPIASSTTSNTSNSSVPFLTPSTTSPASSSIAFISEPISPSPSPPSAPLTNLKQKLQQRKQITKEQQLLTILEDKKKRLLYEIGSLLIVRDQIQEEKRKCETVGIVFDAYKKYEASPATLRMLDEATQTYKILSNNASNSTGLPLTISTPTISYNSRLSPRRNSVQSPIINQSTPVHAPTTAFRMADLTPVSTPQRPSTAQAATSSRSVQERADSTSRPVTACGITAGIAAPNSNTHTTAHAKRAIFSPVQPIFTPASPVITQATQTPAAFSNTVSARADISTVRTHKYVDDDKDWRPIQNKAIHMLMDEDSEYSDYSDYSDDEQYDTYEDKYGYEYEYENDYHKVPSKPSLHPTNVHNSHTSSGVTVVEALGYQARKAQQLRDAERDALRAFDGSSLQRIQEVGKQLMEMKFDWKLAKPKEKVSSTVTPATPIKPHHQENKKPAKSPVRPATASAATTHHHTHHSSSIYHDHTHGTTPATKLHDQHLSVISHSPSTTSSHTYTVAHRTPLATTSANTLHNRMTSHQALSEKLTPYISHATDREKVGTAAATGRPATATPRINWS